MKNRHHQKADLETENWKRKRLALEILVIEEIFRENPKKGIFSENFLRKAMRGSRL